MKHASYSAKAGDEKGKLGQGKDKSKVVYLGLLFSLALVLILSGCGGGGGGGSVNPPSNEGVTIVVEDAFTGSPLSGASVKIGSQTLTTSNNGTAYTASLSPGIYDLTVSKSGYISFPSKIACAQGRQFLVRLTPALSSPVTDETFHRCSRNVFAAAKSLQEAILYVNSSTDQTTQDPIIFFLSASKAFTAAIDNAKTYSPTKGRNSRSVIDALSNFLSLTKVAQGTEQVQQVQQKLYDGQNVPEIDAWLAQHPYEGAHSLQELKNMYDRITLETVIYPRLLRVYQLQAPSSGFNQAMDGAKDIWCSQFTQIGEVFTNLIGWTVDKVWSGTKDLVVNTINYGELVLNNTKQIAWFWDKAKQKLLLGEVDNNKPMTVPQGTMDLVISNGSKHKPTIIDDDVITGAGVQTITNEPQQIGVTPPGAKTYLGTFSGTAIEGDTSYVAWQHSVRLELKLTLEGDGTLISPYKGQMSCDGVDDVSLLVCNDPVGCDPGGVFPINVVMPITGTTNKISGSVSWVEGEATNTLILDATVNGDTITGTLVLASDAFNKPIQKTIELKRQ